MQTYVPPSWTREDGSEAASSRAARSSGQNGSANSTWTAAPGSSKKVEARRVVRSMTWSTTTNSRGRISSRRLPVAPLARTRVTPPPYNA
jgi:hypothetical protein